MFVIKKSDVIEEYHKLKNEMGQLKTLLIESAKRGDCQAVLKYADLLKEKEDVYISLVFDGNEENTECVN